MAVNLKKLDVKIKIVGSSKEVSSSLRLAREAIAESAISTQQFMQSIEKSRKGFADLAPFVMALQGQKEIEKLRRRKKGRIFS